MSEQQNRAPASDEMRASLQKAADPQQDVMKMSQEAFNTYYHLNPKVKQKPELREQNILLSVRHLKF